MIVNTYNNKNTDKCGKYNTRSTRILKMKVKVIGD